MNNILFDTPTTEIDPLKSWSKGELIRIFGCLLFLLSLLSFHPTDPTLFNLFRPASGVGNLLSYPGAILAGTLLAILGKMTYILLFRILLLRQDHQKNIAAVVLSDCLMLLSLIILCASVVNNRGLLLIHTGVIGLIANEVTAVNPGKLITVLICLGLIIRFLKNYSLNRYVISVLVDFFAYLTVVILGTLKFLQNTYSYAHNHTGRFINRRVSPLIRSQISTTRKKISSGPLNSFHTYIENITTGIGDQAKKLLKRFTIGSVLSESRQTNSSVILNNPGNSTRIRKVTEKQALHDAIQVLERIYFSSEEDQKPED